MNVTPVAPASVAPASVAAPAPVVHDPDDFEFDFAMCHGSYYYCRYYQG